MRILDPGSKKKAYDKQGQFFETMAPSLDSASELIGSLRKYTCSHVSENIYNFHYSDDVIRSIEKVFEIDLNKKFRKRGEIRKFIAAMKK